MNSVLEIEHRLCTLYGLEHAILFGRGRAGLFAVLSEVAGIGAPVVIPSNICVAVLGATLAAGAKTLLAPVCPTSGVAEDDRLAQAIEDSKLPNGVLMPTHAYGMVAEYPRSRQLAAERGWFVLENDSLGAATTFPNGIRRAFGDALLVSFGSGKVIDGSGGGAVLTDDASLAAALRRRAANWPVVDSDAERVEEHLNATRRHLLALGHPQLSEPLVELDMAGCQFAFDEALSAGVIAALDGFAAEIERRFDRLTQWDRALRKAGTDILKPAIPMRSPWRAVYYFRDPARRDEVAKALRESGFDAGTNYPPLRQIFRNTLSGQVQPDAERWGATVLTLWLSSAYDDARIERAAATIGRTLDAVATTATR